MTEKKKLLNEWASLKEIEDRAKEQRDKISERLLELYPETVEEYGFKVEIKEGTTTKVDQDDAKSLIEKFGEAAPFRVKYELEKKTYDALKKINESFYKRCSEAVTFTPAKASVKVVKL